MSAVLGVLALFEDLPMCTRVQLGFARCSLAGGDRWRLRCLLPGGLNLTYFYRTIADCATAAKDSGSIATRISCDLKQGNSGIIIFVSTLTSVGMLFLKLAQFEHCVVALTTHKAIAKQRDDLLLELGTMTLEGIDTDGSRPSPLSVAVRLHCVFDCHLVPQAAPLTPPSSTREWRNWLSG